MRNIVTKDHVTSLLVLHIAYPLLSIGDNKGGKRGNGKQVRAPSACVVRPHAHRSGEGAMPLVCCHFSLGVLIPGATTSNTQLGLSLTLPLASCMQTTGVELLCNVIWCEPFGRGMTARTFSFNSQARVLETGSASHGAAAGAAVVRVQNIVRRVARMNAAEVRDDT